jgi:hypothetical protein
VKNSIFEFRILFLAHRIMSIRFLPVLILYSNLFAFDKNFLSFSILWMHHLRYTIFITHHITVADHGYPYMLLEIIDSSQISTPGECLLIRPTMHRYQIGSCSLESLHKVDQEIRIFPTKTSLDGYWYLDGFAHLFDYLECGISVDHQR